MYSGRIEHAIQVALEAHAGQFRKGADLPYVSHPLHAALMLARLGATENAIVAAILHDVVEDCDGWTIRRVREEFDEAVAQIVDDLTEDKSLSWKERKRWAVDHVPDMSADALLVKAADKLHNLNSLVAQLEAAQEPEHVWSKFRGGRERTIEMSAQLVEALAPHVDDRMSSALSETLERLRSL